MVQVARPTIITKALPKIQNFVFVGIGKLFDRWKGFYEFEIIRCTLLDTGLLKNNF